MINKEENDVFPPELERLFVDRPIYLGEDATAKSCAVCGNKLAGSASNNDTVLCHECRCRLISVAYADEPETLQKLYQRLLDL